MPFSRHAPSSGTLGLTKLSTLSSVPDKTPSTSVTIPELAGLRPEDIDILDEVIERAGPTATTFLMVFNAYNEVLLERNMDPNEVAIYGKLLKVGTLRGKNWGEKWNSVKLLHGYGGRYGPSIKSIPAKPFTAVESEAPSDLTSDLKSSAPSLLSTPPSYRAAAHDLVLHKCHAPRRKTRPTSTPAVRSGMRDSALHGIRRGGVMNEGDAWDKMKVVQDERHAEKFHEDKLIDQCWEVWRQSFEWIRTTEQQISQARANLLLRHSLARWQSRTSTRTEAFQCGVTFSNNLLLRATYYLWKSRLKEKRRNAWRDDMRSRMKVVQERQERILLRDTWLKWRQSYQSYLSEQHHTQRLLTRVYRHWQNRLYQVDHLESNADEFRHHVEEKSARKCWEFWKKVTEVRSAEKIIVETVGLRIMNDVLEVWKRRLYDYHAADAFHDILLKKSVMRLWEAALSRIKTLELRAVKHQARQDDLLVRAVARVWRARERGRLLERVRAIRLITDTWTTWKRRLRQQRERDDLALQFCTRPQSTIARDVLQIWRRVYITHRNAHTFALQYYAAKLQYGVLLTWRIKLRAVFKLVKQARMVRNNFAVGRAWRTWVDKYVELRRTKMLKTLERQRLKKMFDFWATRAQQQRLRKIAERKVQIQVALRIKTTALTRWTNRVIDLKLRELDVTQKCETDILIRAFKKWTAVCIRHVEVLNLMESHQEVKREEVVRRMFHRWLSATRATRYRRITHGKKEDQLKLAFISVAWDKWRDRFCDERLRPIEYQVLIQNQKSLLFYALQTWRAKTKSLPAIRFHATHIKAKYWSVWRNAMPRALQARRAREMHKKMLLETCIRKWAQTYQTRLALKAVVRARHLRLPVATPQAATPPSQMQTPSASAIFPRRTVNRPLEHSQEAGYRRFSFRPPREHSPARSAVSTSGLLESRSTSRRPSVVGSEEGRSRLLLELRRVYK